MNKQILSVVLLVFFIFNLKATTTLVSFEAFTHNSKVDLKWIIKTEDANSFFIVERSKDNVLFEEVVRVESVAKGQSYMEYFDSDYSPLEGVSYYRLKQIDSKKEELLNNVVSISYYKPIQPIHPEIAITENPHTATTDFSVLLKGFEGKEVLVVLHNKKGDEFFSKVYLSGTDHHLVAVDPKKRLPKGEYVITASVNNHVYSKSIVVK